MTGFFFFSLPEKTAVEKKETLFIHKYLCEKIMTSCYF